MIVQTTSVNWKERVLRLLMVTAQMNKEKEGNKPKYLHAALHSYQRKLTKDLYTKLRTQINVTKKTNKLNIYIQTI